MRPLPAGGRPPRANDLGAPRRSLPRRLLEVLPPVEDASGSLAASVWHSTTNENGDDGVHLDENAAGDLLASAAHGTSSRNEDDGLVGDEGGAGGGTLEVVFMTLADNGGDDLVVVGDVVLTQMP